MNGVVFQCASCRALSVATSIDVDGKRAGLRCDACGARTSLPIAGTGAGPTVVVDADAATRATQPERALTAGLTLVPSATVTSIAPSLVAAPPAVALTTTFDADARRRIDERTAKLGGDGDDLAQEFTALLGAWANEAEHTRFLKKAAMTDRLAFAGQRYRAVLDVVPNDARAKKAQNDILTLAMAAFGTKKDLGDVPAKGARGIYAAGAVVFFVVMAAIAIWFAPKLLLHDDASATMNAEPR